MTCQRCRLCIGIAIMARGFGMEQRVAPAPCDCCVMTLDAIRATCAYVIIQVQDYESREDADNIWQAHVYAAGHKHLICLTSHPHERNCAHQDGM